jgi:hypothetical protein
MSSEIDTTEGDNADDKRPGPGSRLAHGVRLSVAGPLYILLGLLGLTRGVLGFGIGSVLAGARWAGGRCRSSEEGSQDLALVQEVASSGRRRRPLLIVGVTVAVLALGGVAFSIVRRSMQPEPSPLPPSVDVNPQP